MKCHPTIYLFLAALIVVGCKSILAEPPPPTTPPGLATTLTPDAQAELDSLNYKCINSAAWRAEYEFLENPNDPNRLVSGECRAFVSLRKARLAAYGVKVKWNSEKGIYEAEK